MATITLPEYGQHLVYAGTTGSGKTELARTMLRPYESWFVIDTQDSLGEKLPKHHVITDPHLLPQKLIWFKKIRYAPKGEYRNTSTWNYVFQTLNYSSKKKKPRKRIVYIDEIYHVGYGTSFPRWLPTAITTARQKGISYWISTQRPSMIPIPVMSETTRIYIFFLKYEEDIKKMAKFSRNKNELMKAMLEQTLDHSFIEVDQMTGEFRHLPPIKLRR